MEGKLAQKASKLLSKNISLFKKTSQLYRSVVENDLEERTCTGEECTRVYRVELRINNKSKWGTSPKSFPTEEEAEQEAIELKRKFPFISEFRIVSRNEKV